MRISDWSSDVCSSDLPLLFGRRPPQSNYPPHTVPDPDYGPRLERQARQGGISRMAPLQLAPQFHGLPPILHRRTQRSVCSYSKGSRGLSVLPRERCIFTERKSTRLNSSP